jgi:hypothetical protein
LLPEEIKFPLYAKAIFLLIGLFVLVAILYIARAIIVPVDPASRHY